MLIAQHIHFKRKNRTLLDHLNFNCNAGQFIAILGPNGAGKSTLLSILADEQAAFAHSISFHAKTYKAWDRKLLPIFKAKFSQSYNADIPLTVSDVVLMGRYPYFEQQPNPSDLEAVLNAMTETDVAHLKEREYNHLSGGEKQRVHLARVLAQLENEHREKILFLDEPLNNLDVSHQHRVLQSIKKFTALGNSAVVVLHDLNLASQFSDQILLMKDGKSICFGPPEKILQTDIIREVYNFPCLITKNPITNHPLILFG